MHLAWAGDVLAFFSHHAKLAEPACTFAGEMLMRGMLGESAVSVRLRTRGGAVSLPGLPARWYEPADGGKKHLR